MDEDPQRPDASYTLASLTESYPSQLLHHQEARQLEEGWFELFGEYYSSDDGNTDNQQINYALPNSNEDLSKHFEFVNGGGPNHIVKRPNGDIKQYADVFQDNRYHPDATTLNMNAEPSPLPSGDTGSIHNTSNPEILKDLPTPNSSAPSSWRDVREYYSVVSLPESGVKFVCKIPDCDYECSHRGNMERHVAKKEKGHLGNRSTCGVCKASFARPNFLKDHMQKKHGDSDQAPAEGY